MLSISKAREIPLKRLFVMALSLDTLSADRETFQTAFFPLTSTFSSKMVDIKSGISALRILSIRERSPSNLIVIDRVSSNFLYPF